MIRTLLERGFLTMLNIFFPPLAVWWVTGPGRDVLMNCILFLLAVIPSHIHGFYISWTYFFRRRKAKKGKYPGGPRPFIYSQKVINGGLSNAKVKELWRRKEYGLDQRRGGRRVASRHDNQTQRKDAHRPRSTARRPSMQHQTSQTQKTSTYHQAQRLNSQADHATQAYGDPWPTYR